LRSEIASHKSSTEAEGDDAPQTTYDHLTDREVRDVRRQLTKWIGECTSAGRDVKDIRETRLFADGMLGEGSEEVERMMWTRTSMEVRVVRQLKRNRHLYDGSAAMPMRHREKWEAFVEEKWWSPEKMYEREAEEDRQRRHEAGELSDDDSASVITDDSRSADSEEDTS